MNYKFQIINFATIRIFVVDIKKSRNWYKSFFNLDPVEDLENFVSFRLENICFDISLADSKSPLSCGGAVGYWLVDNLENAISKALSLGGSIYRGPLNVDEVQRTIVQIKDPYDNIIGLEALYDSHQKVQN